MHSIVRVTHVVLNGRKVYQLERIKSVRGNRALALNSRRPALSPASRVQRAFEALRKAVTA